MQQPTCWEMLYGPALPGSRDACKPDCVELWKIEQRKFPKCVPRSTGLAVHKKLWGLKFLPFAMVTVSHHQVSRCWFFEGKVAGCSCTWTRRKKGLFLCLQFCFCWDMWTETNIIYTWAICWKVGTKDGNRVHLGNIQNHHAIHAIHAKGLSWKLGEHLAHLRDYKLTNIILSPWDCLTLPENNKKTTKINGSWWIAGIFACFQAPKLATFERGW